MQSDLFGCKPHVPKRQETEWERLCGGLRDMGYELDGPEGKTNLSIAKRWHFKIGIPVDEILQVAEGFMWKTRDWVLRDQWQGPPALRPLYSKKLNDGKERTPLWREAEIEWNNRNKRAPSNLFAKGRIRLVIE